MSKQKCGLCGRRIEGRKHGERRASVGLVHATCANTDAGGKLGDRRKRSVDRFKKNLDAQQRADAMLRSRALARAIDAEIVYRVSNKRVGAA